MPLTTISSLRIAHDPQEADRLFDVALNQVEAVAESHFSGRNFTIRDLVPSDMPGNSNNEWTETSGSDNEYATTTAGNASAIADDTIICIYGITFPTATTTAAPLVTALRFTVGASLRAQLDLHEILTFEQGGTGAGEAVVGKKGFLVTPIIITSQQTLKIEEYTTTATTAYQMHFHGFVAEIQGKTIEA
jgi:hypothetical protein